MATDLADYKTEKYNSSKDDIRNVMKYTVYYHSYSRSK